MGTFLFLIFLSAGIAVGSTTVLASPAHTSFFGEHERGWHWYEPVPTCEEPAADEDTPESRDAQKQNHRPKTPSDLIKAYREELENRLHAAWVYPTPQNIKAYQEMQKDMMDRSKVFSTVWLQTVFQNPELDHTLISPVNQRGRHLQIDLEKNRTFEVIKGLSQTWGLFFFFSNDCPYCHQFAPIVKKFASSYQWEVIAIQIGDSSAIGTNNQDDISKLFPNVQPNNGLFQAWGIKVLPTLFAVNPKTQEAIPVAYGLTSLDEMENRIMTLLGDKG